MLGIHMCVILFMIYRLSCFIFSMTYLLYPGSTSIKLPPLSLSLLAVLIYKCFVSNSKYQVLLIPPKEDW